MKMAWSFLYKLVLALWIGGIAIFTFVVTPAIFRAYGRDMAGEIVGRLFPGYFLYTLLLSVAALLFFLPISFSVSNSRHKFTFVLIVGAILINLFVSQVLHPQIRTVKQEIHSFETLPPDAPLRKQFTRLHAVSAALNLIVLADGVLLLLLGSGIKK